MSPNLSRRHLIAAALASGLVKPLRAQTVPFRLGLTPVFLSNDAEVLRYLQSYLQDSLGRPVEFVQRRTYQEVMGLLLGGSLDAAWICGYPYLQHEAALAVVGVPLWRGRPLYRSYLIVAPDSPAKGLVDLRGDIHAFSDPDSNSGYLVTTSDLAKLNERPDKFFGRTIFTYGHRNVVRAVAGGLTQSGSVDGYVWEALARSEPALTRHTRVLEQSEWLGFPPIACQIARRDGGDMVAFADALLGMAESATGQKALSLLQLDGFVPGDRALFDGIAARMRLVAGRG